MKRKNRIELSDFTVAPRKELDESYVLSLTDSVENRMQEGATLREAIGSALMERAPVLLRRPHAEMLYRGRYEEEEDEDSGTGWGLTILFGVAAGIGLDVLARRTMGKSLFQLISEQVEARMGGGETGEDGGAEAYPTVHNTAGAEMPRPESEQGLPL